jgi:flagellar hook-associated protein 2
LNVLTNSFSTALSGITSSNSGVAYIAPSAGTNYAVNVTQLAKVQQTETNLTGTSNATDYGTSGTTQVYNTGTLQIQVGNIDTTAGTFSASANPITVTVKDGSLAGIANAINAANAGVGASVVADSNGNYQLKLTGGNTGAANGFEITGTDTGSGFASLAGLDYSATGGGPSGPGTNNTNYGNTTAPIQQAQDAQYTVNGQQLASPTNLNVPVAPGVNLNLLTTGSTIISQPQAPTAVVNAANNLVATINGVFQVVQQYTGTGGPLANDPSILQEFQNDVTLALNSTYGSGNTELLSQLGITQQADGTYAVNTSTLAQTYQENPNATQNLLSQVASGLLQVTQNYSGQYGSVTNQITELQNQESIYAGQYQTDSQVSSTSNATAADAVNAYNLLSESNGGSASSFTSQV